MRHTTTILFTALLLPTFLFGCSESVRAYRYDDHVIRIDQSNGAANARVFVDECPVEGVYYDRVSQQWGVTGYTYGASYWEIDHLAQDMASWGAARCGRPTATTSGGLASR